MTDPSEALAEVLSKYDSSTEKISEEEISDSLRRIGPEKGAKLPTDWFAEYLAFHFSENNQEGLWGTYFGPTLVFRDGSVSPNIDQITPEIIDYWEKRIKDTKHPIMRTRYADLVWDFTRKVIGKHPDIMMALITIDSILEISQRDCHKYEVYVIKKLERALSLAISINHPEKIKAVVNAIMAYEDHIAEDDKPGLWGFSFDLLLNNKKIAMTAEQKDKLISDLENRLERLLKNSTNQFAIQFAAIPLANYYRKIGQLDDMKRVLLKYGQFFEIASDISSALQASGWLEQVFTIYINYGLRDEAEKITTKINDLGPKIIGEMKTVFHSLDIPEDKINVFAAKLTEGDLDTVLLRIVTHFIPKKHAIENQLKELSEAAPLSFSFSKRIYDHQGRPSATVGPLEDDLNGNIIQQMSQNMMLSAIFLRKTMETFLQRFSLSPEQLTDYVYRSPIFKLNKKEILKKGIQAYLECEYLIAIHLLIPQIEDGIRNLVEMTGGSILKQSRSGGLNYKLLDELLREPQVIEVIIEDVALYFRTLLTDPTGLNIRNLVSHGLLQFEAFNVVVADRLFHVLLCLAMVRDEE